MELILHPIPIDAVGAHAGPVLTGQQVAALPPRRRATKAGPEAAPQRAEQVDLAPLISFGQPGAAGTDHIEDEPEPAALGIRPGGAVGPAQERVWRAHRQLKELPWNDGRCRRRMEDHELNRPGHRNRALDDNGGCDRDAHARATSAATAPTYSASVATLDRCSRRQARCACTRALAVSSEVRHGIRRSTDARRISYPSLRGAPPPLLATGPDDETVFTTRWTWPDRITSTTLGWPSRNFCTVVAGIADSLRKLAVPAVA